MVEGEQNDPGKVVAQSYVCGFMFSLDLRRVALIRKNRPEWQKGKLNGIGGKIEPGESAYDAMAREFLEETGVDERYTWNNVITLDLARGGSIYIFACASAKIDHLSSVTDELVMVYDVKDLQLLGTMPNVQWIVPMLLSFTKGEKTGSFAVKEVA